MSTQTFQGKAQIITASAGQLPSRIEIFPTGTITLQDQRGSVGIVRDPADLAQRSIAAATGNIIPIDFGHGMDGLAGENPRAAGWITALSVEGDRIMADVDWTAEGEEMLRGKMFRFISPTFTVDEKSKDVGLILRAGLTNDPALPQLRQVASKETQDMPQRLKDLAAKLGLPDDADEATIQAAAEKAVDQVAHLQPVITAAGLKGDLTEAAAAVIVTKMTASAGSGDPDPAQFVPRASFDEMKVQLASLQKQVTNDRAEDVVTAAMADGKLAPSMEKWGRDYATKDLEGFKTWLAATPVIVDGKVQTPAGDPPDKDPDVLTDDEKALCASTNTDPEAFLATKKALAGAKTKGA